MAPAMKRLFEWLGLTDSAEEFDPEYDEASAHSEFEERQHEERYKNSNVQVFSEPNDRRPSRTPRSDNFKSAKDSSYFERRQPEFEDSLHAARASVSTDSSSQEVAKPFVGTSSIKPIQHAAKPTVHILYPQIFNDGTEVADLMRDGMPVILNLHNAEVSLRRRLIDFCSGITYALEGRMEKVASSVFLITPSNVTVSQEERAKLSERGVF